MFRKIKLNNEKLKRGFITKELFNQSLQSYYGILKHCSGFKIRKNIVFLTTEAAITDLPEKNPPVGGPMGGGMGMGM